MKVAIVILNWNGAKLLEQFLPSVVQYTTEKDVEIVVADNFSTDESIAFLRKNYSDLRVIALPTNYGYAEGYNKALEQTDAEYFVLLNSDVEVTQDWLMPLIAYMDRNPEIAAAQPKILAQRCKTHFEYAGAAGGFLDKYGYPFCRGRIFSKLEEDRGQYDTVLDILWATGACLVIRSKDYLNVGGLDASFFAHMEEIDMCWRLNARGKRIVCYPQSTVFHVGGATLEQESPRKTFLNFRNNLLMLYKNLPEDRLRKTLAIRKILDYIAAIEFSLTGKWANAKEIHRAHQEFRKIRSSYLSARKENMSKATTHLVSTIYDKSILLGYYLKGIKYFSQIINF